MCSRAVFAEKVMILILLCLAVTRVSEECSTSINLARISLRETLAGHWVSIAEDGPMFKRTSPWKNAHGPRLFTNYM